MKIVIRVKENVLDRIGGGVNWRLDIESSFDGQQWGGNR
jgi:hypothetical protein